MTASLRATPAVTLLRRFHRAYRKVREVDGIGIARFGLSDSEFDVVATLGNTAGLRMSDIAQRTLTSPANVTRVVKLLESKALLARNRGAASDREVVARLTLAGDRLFDRIYPQHYRFMVAALDAALTPNQQATLSELLERLAKLEAPAAASAVPEPAPRPKRTRRNIHH